MNQPLFAGSTLLRMNPSTGQLEEADLSESPLLQAIMGDEAHSDGLGGLLEHLATHHMGSRKASFAARADGSFYLAPGDGRPPAIFDKDELPDEALTALVDARMAADTAATEAQIASLEQRLEIIEDGHEKALARVAGYELTTMDIEGLAELAVEAQAYNDRESTQQSVYRGLCRMAYDLMIGRRDHREALDKHHSAMAEERAQKLEQRRLRHALANATPGLIAWLRDQPNYCMMLFDNELSEAWLQEREVEFSDLQEAAAEGAEDEANDDDDSPVDSEVDNEDDPAVDDSVTE